MHLHNQLICLLLNLILPFSTSFVSLLTQKENIAAMESNYQVPTFDPPELRTTRNVLYGLLVLNFVVYIGLIILCLFSVFWIASFSVFFIILYYSIEGPLFVNRNHSQASCQCCCCWGCYNWLITLTFRTIWLLHDFAYFVVYAIYASNSKDQMNFWCDDFCDNFYCHTYCLEYTQHYIFGLASSLVFLITFGIGIGIIVAFSKFPKTTGFVSNETYQTQTVSGQGQPMQTVQQMPNGQLVVIPNSNLGVSNSNFGIAQQPQAVQSSVPIVQEPAVIQQASDQKLDTSRFENL